MHTICIKKLVFMRVAGDLQDRLITASQLTGDILRKVAKCFYYVILRGSKAA